LQETVTRASELFKTIVDDYKKNGVDKKFEHLFFIFDQLN